MNDQAFSEIKNEYDSYYNELLRNGNLPLRSTGKGFWGHVPAIDIYEAFSKLKLHRHKTFIDLGSGDGKAVLIASLFCKRAVGIESDNELFKKSMEMQNRLKLSNTIFFNNDFYDHNVAGFDIVFSYPDEPMHRNLEKKLSNELTGRLLHCGHHFHPESFSKEKSILVNGTAFTLYSR
ncbi:class I SAM-dependent methyltransferase [Candidatus Woesearchaeota archaeon]|nr:class I SAM-dependent methyltransferase [Candidatus Woesearchaeota archaeon]